MTIPDAAGLEPWLAKRESAVPGLRPGCAKRILWAGAAGKRTPQVLVYVHGFSATGQELRPLPDRVAAALGANLFFTRLTGHGQDGAALGRARLRDWQADLDEAFAIGRALGRETVVMACSTGAPLVAAALAAGAAARAVLLVSPNWGLRSRLAQWLLDAPGAPVWGRAILGRERAFEVVSDAHAAYWTPRYDSAAVHTMAAAVRVGRKAVTRVTVPAFVGLSEADQVVSPAATRRVMARWGGPVTWHVVETGPEDDPMAHVIAGDIFSPARTAALAAAMGDWLARVP